MSAVLDTHTALWSVFDRKESREQRSKPSGDKTYHYFKLMLVSVDQKPHSLKAVPRGKVWRGKLAATRNRSEEGGQIL